MNDWAEAYFQCGTAEAEETAAAVARVDLEVWEEAGVLIAETALVFWRDHRGTLWALPVSDIETDRPRISP